MSAHRSRVENLQNDWADRRLGGFDLPPNDHPVSQLLEGRSSPQLTTEERLAVREPVVLRPWRLKERWHHLHDENHQNKM